MTSPMSAFAYFILLLHFAWVVDDAKCIVVTRVCVCVCMCVSVCLWPALLPFNVDRFWWNLVTRTMLWSSLAATIMDQIGRRGTARRLFENLKKNSQKSQNSNFRIMVHHFLRLCLLDLYCKKIWLDSNKTDGGAAAVDDRRADPEMLRPHHSADPNWGHSELGAQSGHKNQPACLCVCVSYRHFYPSSLTDFDETWSQGPYCDLVLPRP